MLSDKELWSCSREQLIQHVQKTQHEKLTLLHEHSNKMKDVNQRLQTHLLEIRNLKEINKKVQDDNQELRELCCFIDDDRQKYRNLSREWQRFGKHTSSVIKSEVASHQTKFQTLSVELDGLLKDNEELKELVIYLDNERCSALRDQGDGSSGNSDDQPTTASTTPTKKHTPSTSTQPTEETMKYIQHLEERIDLLEAQLKKQLDKAAENPWLSTSNISQAMKVLEVHKKIEQTPTIPGRAGSAPSHSQHAHSASQHRESLDSHEKALLRELCNVAWRTLEEDSAAKPNRPLIPQNSRV